MRPVVPLQSPGHLSDSKLYSANPHSRTQARLSLPSGFLQALGFFLNLNLD